jgi:uncharacterized protein YbcV (DUF1398 family)
MFTVHQIKAAHQKVKSGADFPRYVQEIKALGLVKYEFMIADGHTVYSGKDGQAEAPPKYPVKTVNPVSSAQALAHNIRIHQQGQTDFLTFCEQAAEAGVHHWEVNTQTMLCTYFDSHNEIMIAEPIPESDY